MVAQAPSNEPFEPRITAFVCNWCTYTGADLAGTSRLEMAPNIRIIRLPCTGRIDPLFVLKAFERGADGVVVSGCHPSDCHYTSGNYHARRRFTVLWELLQFIGIEPERFVCTWVSASEGVKWQQVVNRTTESIRQLGPFDAYHNLIHGSTPTSPLFMLDPPSSPALGDGRGEAWQQRSESELRDLAATILQEHRAEVVIGWEEGPRGVRPCFVTQPEESARLVFDRRCVANLATYLSPRRRHLQELGRKAVVVKGCDARAVAGLIREGQLARDDVVLIGVHCHGVVGSTGSLAERCTRCDAPSPRLCDHLVGEPPSEPPPATTTLEDVAALDAATPTERWSFWQGELSRCVRCAACRAICPLCSCERCVADKTRPQWIEPSAHPRGILAWHLIRAQHLAGRCVDCGECQRACPAGIPLGLLTAKVREIVQRRFGYAASDDPETQAPLGAFDAHDTQEFYL